VAKLPMALPRRNRETASLLHAPKRWPVDEHPSPNPPRYKIPKRRARLTVRPSPCPSQQPRVSGFTESIEHTTCLTDATNSPHRRTER